MVVVLDINSEPQLVVIVLNSSQEIKKKKVTF